MSVLWQNFSPIIPVSKVLLHPHSLLKVGLNTNGGEIINIRLRPASSVNSFYDFNLCMETMLHELAHNVHGEHDKQFYALLEEITKEWELLSSKGYKGEGFFSQGQRLGKGHVFYKPSIAASAAERRRIKDAVERRERGINTGPGKRLGAPEDAPVMGQPLGVSLGQGQPLGQPFGQTLGQPPGDSLVGYRLGGGYGGGEYDENFQDPKRLAAIAAERRANDQKRCGAKQASGDMRRETQKAQREGKRTQAKDMPAIIDLSDIQDYDLKDSIMNLSVPTASLNGPTMAVDMGDWMCNQCTFLNPPLYLACQMCETERKLNSNVATNHIDLTDENIQQRTPAIPPDNYIDLTEEHEQPWKAGDNAGLFINGRTGKSWSCHACTFKNENVVDEKCLVCGTKQEEDDIFDFL